MTMIMVCRRITRVFIMVHHHHPSQFHFEVCGSIYGYFAWNINILSDVQRAYLYIHLLSRLRYFIQLFYRMAVGSGQYIVVCMSLY